MTPAADIPEETAAELLRLMGQADGGQPFMTHKAAAAMGAFILSELATMARRAAENEAASVRQEWGTVGQVAKIYGMTAARADDYLLAWVAAGKVRVLTPPNPRTGRPGHKRYNLADVAACMAGKGVEA